MEKYIKAAAAIIGIGALGYVGYRVVARQPMVRVRTSVQLSTGPDTQVRAAETSEQRAENGGLDHINKTHFGILWRRAGTSQIVRREGVLHDGTVYANVDGKLLMVVMTNGKLHRGIQMNPGAEGVGCPALIDHNSDSVVVAGAINALMFQTTE